MQSIFNKQSSLAVWVAVCSLVGISQGCSGSTTSAQSQTDTNASAVNASSVQSQTVQPRADRSANKPSDSYKAELANQLNGLPQPSIERNSNNAVFAAPTAEDLINAVRSMTPDNRSEVKAQIANNKSSGSLVNALSRELVKFPVTDHSRCNAILSVLGEMENAEAIPALVNFVWHVEPKNIVPIQSNDDPNFEPPPPDLRGMLNARAVEMLAYLKTDRAFDEVLRVIREHPLSEVREAAINAYMFNHNDSPEAEAKLRTLVKPEDVRAIGVPRLTSSTDMREFEAKVEARLAQYPDMVPPSSNQGE